MTLVEVLLLATTFTTGFFVGAICMFVLIGKLQGEF